MIYSFDFMARSHPLPKRLPLPRLVDQSNLWSGDQSTPWLPSSEIPSLIKPKVKNCKNSQSPTDHSIAV